MPSAVIKSIRMAQESAFGSLDAATLEPDVSIFDPGGDAVDLNCNRASLSGDIGDVETNDDDGTRDGFYTLAPDVETLPADAGGMFHRRTGKLTLTINLEGYGEADSDDVPVTWLFDAALVGIGKPTVASEAATVNATAQVFEVADDSAYPLGALFSATLKGKLAEFSSVVAKPGGNLLHHTPALSAELGDTTTVRACRTWAGGVKTTLGPSLAFRIDGHKWRTFAFGCRPESIKLTGSKRRIQLTVELMCALIYDVHTAVSGVEGTNISGPAYRTGGQVMHALGAQIVASDPIDVDDAAYPRIPGRHVLEVDNWEVSVVNTLEKLGEGMSASVLGCSEMEVVDRATSAKFGITPDQEFDQDLLLKRYRNWMIGFGPGGAAGSGGCVFIPAGHLTADASKRAAGGTRVQQSLELSSGGWHGDAGDATAASNTPVRIGLVV